MFAYYTKQHESIVAAIHVSICPIVCDSSAPVLYSCVMKQVAIVALALGIAASSAWASDDTSTLLQLNAQLQDRTKAYDVAGVEKLITNDYTLINGSGAVWDRQAFLRDVGDRSAVWEINQPEDVRVRLYNNDTALVIGVLHMRYRLGGRVHDLRARYTDVWVKMGGTWKYASGQATKMSASST